MTILNKFFLIFFFLNVSSGLFCQNVEWIEYTGDDLQMEWDILRSAGINPTVDYHLTFDHAFEKEGVYYGYSFVMTEKTAVVVNLIIIKQMIYLDQNGNQTRRSWYRIRPANAKPEHYRSANDNLPFEHELVLYWGLDRDDVPGIAPYSGSVLPTGTEGISERK